MGSKFSSFILVLHKYLLLSLEYWRGLIKSGLIYGVVPATVALIMTYMYIQSAGEIDEYEVKEVFDQNFIHFNRYRLSSFLVSLSYIVASSMFFFTIKGGHGWLVAGLLIYFLLLISTTFSYAMFFMAKKTINIKIAFALGFTMTIKRFGSTLLLWLAYLSFAILAYYNLILFIVLFPVGYVMIVEKVSRSITLPYHK